MDQKPDVVRDFPAYVADRIRLKPQLAQVAQLRDARKVSQSRDLLKKIESSALYRRVKRFEELYAPQPR